MEDGNAVLPVHFLWNTLQKILLAEAVALV
jgi:hypothetical protein